MIREEGKVSEIRTSSESSSGSRERHLRETAEPWSTGRSTEMALVAGLLQRQKGGERRGFKWREPLPPNRDRVLKECGIYALTGGERSDK